MLNRSSCSLALLLLTVFCVLPLHLASSHTDSEGRELRAAANNTARQPPPAPVAAPAPAPSDGGEPVPVSWYLSHGFLMWIAFGFLMPAGIIIARFLQTVSPFWFHLHWVIQSVAVACAVGGFAVAVAGFQALTDSTHAMVGIAIFVATGLQPLVALVRPHKGTAWRVAFYAFHWTVGMGAVALGWWNIYTGIELYGEDWGTDVTVIQSLFVASIAVIGFVYLVLSRWDYLVSQADAKPMIDGITRFPSMYHVTSLARLRETAGYSHA